MKSQPRPTILLISCVVLPALLLAGAGVVLLQHERERWETSTLEAETRWLEQTRRELRLILEDLRNELQEELQLVAGSPVQEEALRELHDEHPLVRNVFLTDAEGGYGYPSPEEYNDDETRRFLQKYDALFSGRLSWDQRREQEEEPLASSSKRPSFSRVSLPSKKRGASPPSQPVIWRAWHWEDSDTLLVYLQHPEGWLGVEVEMAALLSRVDVVLRSITEGAIPLSLMDRHGRFLTQTIAISDPSVHLTLPAGELLPFAQLVLHAPIVTTTTSNGTLYTAALLLGLLLVGSILAGGIGLNAWLQRSRREALQKTTFVSNVSHEFKTPLTTLRLYSELLLEGRVKDPEKQQRYLRTLLQESDRLARLVHNVLDFSRLEMGRQKLSLEAFDLCDCFASVQESLAARMQGVAFDIQLPEHPIQVRADRDAAGQILLNLCDNAVKYAAEGTKLEVTAEPKGAMWNIIFHDDGPGISGKQRKGLFQPFHQGDERLTREHGGTGLGLHLSRRLAREMKGDLVYRSTPQGACFVWSVPREENAT